MAVKEKYITNFDEIISGFLKRSIAYINKKKATNINAIALTKAAKTSARLYPNVLLKEAFFLDNLDAIKLIIKLITSLKL